MTHFKLLNNHLQANKAQLKTGFELLRAEASVTSKFYEPDSSILAFFFYLNKFTQSNFSGKDAPEICEFFLENSFQNEILRIGEYFAQNTSLIKVEPGDDEEEACRSLFLLNLYITNFLTAYSRRLCVKYFELGAAKHMIQMLSTESFVTEFASQRAFQFLLLNISVLASEADSYKSEWAELNAVDILLKIADLDKTFQRTSYGTVLRIANDKQITQITEKPEIVSIFIKSIAKAADEILRKGVNLKREKMEYGDEDGDKDSAKAFDVYSVEDEFDVNIRYPITGVLNTLYKLSVNDKVKYDLYVKHNSKDPLKTIIFQGSDIEKRYAVKLLAQLCFDSLVLDMVSRDLELVAQIELLAKTDAPSVKALPETCKQIVWSLNARNTGQLDKNAADGVKKQIMISYNSGSRDLCIRIKQELERAGFKIWIDIEEIHGSSLDSMAHAVESSEIVLICITENYRQSINCQAEAQYAFKLKKPIIPLIMQKGYESVGGWLGMIMGDRIYISFLKHTFEDANGKLQAQVSRIIPGEKKPQAEDTVSLIKVEKSPVLTTAAAKSEAANKSPVLTWSEEQVEEWFKKNGNTHLYEHLKPCNGELLFQLYEMKTTAPEFYYQFIAVENKIDRRSLLVFTNNLKKLFDSSSS